MILFLKRTRKCISKAYDVICFTQKLFWNSCKIQSKKGLLSSYRKCLQHGGFPANVKKHPFLKYHLPKQLLPKFIGKKLKTRRVKRRPFFITKGKLSALRKLLTTESFKNNEKCFLFHVKSFFRSLCGCEKLYAESICKLLEITFKEVFFLLLEENKYCFWI